MKNTVEYGFLNPPVDETVKSMEQKTRVFLDKLMSKNSISEDFCEEKVIPTWRWYDLHPLGIL